MIYLAPGANDTIFAGNGHDNVQGGFHDDVVYGGDGNDSIQGDSSKVDDLGIPIVPSQLHGRDYLAGEGGDDTIDGNGGDDIVYGGTGNDLLDGDSRYFASSTDAEYHGDDYVDGGTGDDTISGSGGADILLGGAGSDVLFGDLDGLDAMHHGDDVLYGDDGNDQLVGQGGDDVLNGGTGNDILYGDDLDVGAVQGNDQLFGGAGADELSGGLGADTLSGGEDDDGLWGDAGDDRLSGGKGAIISKAERALTPMCCRPATARKWRRARHHRRWCRPGQPPRVRIERGHGLHPPQPGGRQCGSHHPLCGRRHRIRRRRVGWIDRCLLLRWTVVYSLSGLSCGPHSKCAVPRRRCRRQSRFRRRIGEPAVRGGG
ncbi:MAG: hypothetical protein H6962_15275 [Chromatiaceae bacterium]|nr:hypothetical protein [Chromatiaceae bacterium]